MDRTQIEQQIEQLLAQQGVRTKHLSSTARLRHDLGLDGDDAVEFFLALATRFGTDLTVLKEEWGTHFGPDRLSVGAAAALAACVAIIGAVAMLGGPPGLGAIALAAVVVGVTVWLIGRRGSTGQPPPITVADVANAVARGRWEQPSRTVRGRAGGEGGSLS